MRLASLVYGPNLHRKAARSLLDNGRASHSPLSALDLALRDYGQSARLSDLVGSACGSPAHPSASSPIIFVRHGEGSMVHAPADPHVVGIDFHITSCQCACHYGPGDCSPLPGTRSSLADCSLVRR